MTEQITNSKGTYRLPIVNFRQSAVNETTGAHTFNGLADKHYG
jgi:hypothetical protein